MVVRFCFAMLLSLCATFTAAYTYEERQALDLSEYVVRDPDAGFFDVAARRAFLLNTSHDVLRLQVERMKMGFSCRDYLELPIIDQRVIVPPFYADPARWRAHAQPYFAFEDMTSELAAAQLVAEDTYHAECLIDVLLQWARARAFEDFHYETVKRQAWYQIESSVFAAAMAYSTVRPLITTRTGDLREIEAWFTRIATKHSAIRGGRDGSCCNNHFYRRALYAAMIGVLTQNNDLFRFGVSSVLSAIEGATPEGALPIEMARGPLAAHYQNYAVMYLMWTAQIAERQGYPLFEMEIEGRTLHTLIDFNIRILQDLQTLEGFAPVEGQKLTYQQDDQYFAWFELYLSRYDRPAMERMIDIRRPLYNRSAGGFTTLLFYDPERFSTPLEGGS